MLLQQLVPSFWWHLCVSGVAFFIRSSVKVKVMALRWMSVEVLFLTTGNIFVISLSLCLSPTFTCMHFKFLKLNHFNFFNLVASGASIVMFHGDLPYSSKDIIRKLENLNEEHIIGCGGFGTVYKLAMDDGNEFALKRILKMNEGFDRFFERELEILGSIKHRYLVNLRGYCNSPTSKLLIYDFLAGGSLDEALHGKYWNS